MAKLEELKEAAEDAVFKKGQLLIAMMELAKWQTQLLLHK